jgi:hypothetical protein
VHVYANRKVLGWTFIIGCLANYGIAQNTPYKLLVLLMFQDVCRQSRNCHLTGDHWKIIRKLSNVGFGGLNQSPDKRGISPTLKIKQTEETIYKVYFSSAQTLPVSNVKK